MNNIVISKNIEKQKENFRKARIENMHVLADFDQTLTQAFVGGKIVPSMISLLRDGNYLADDYASKAKALYVKYHAVEIDPNIPIEEKKTVMEEWWMTHFDLLIKSGLNKEDIRSIVDSGKLKLREGAKEFFNICLKHDIPVVILSSSGLGGDPIRIFLEKEGTFHKNTYIISNTFIWDEEGNAIDLKKPILHGMNKDEIFVRDFPIFDIIKQRKNVLLLGNSFNDVGMITGFDCKNLIKIGFLNEKIEENLEEFKKIYDVIILNDGSMEYINKFLKEIS